MQPVGTATVAFDAHEIMWSIQRCTFLKTGIKNREKYDADYSKKICKRVI